MVEGVWVYFPQWNLVINLCGLGSLILHEHIKKGESPKGGTFVAYFSECGLIYGFKSIG